MTSILRHTRIGSRGLFKPDHPRSIDRYIDYFGGATGDAASLIDGCGEGLLDSFDGQDVQAEQPELVLAG